MPQVTWKEHQLLQYLSAGPSQLNWFGDGKGRKAGADRNKGKGKGKNGKGDKGKGRTMKGDKGQGKGKGTDDLTCACCGKEGHAKQECWHPETCSNCGKPGHLGYMCNQPKKEEDGEVAVQQDNGDKKKQQEEKETWECSECWATNADINLRKCRTKSCCGQSPNDAREAAAAPQDETPSALSKNTKSMMSSEDDTERDEQDQEVLADIQRLKDQKTT